MNGQEVIGFRVGDDILGGIPFHIRPSNSHLSGNGNRVAIGAIENSKGSYFEVYEWSGAEWTQLGQTVRGVHHSDYLGYAVELSHDGNLLVVSAPRKKINSVEKGVVRVYRWNGIDWEQLGNDLIGDSDGTFFGGHCSISSDGSTISTTLQLHDTINMNHPGAVLSYRWNGNIWRKLGKRIELTEDSWGGFMSQVSLSENGSKLAISNLNARMDDITFGLVKVYHSAVVNSEHKSNPKISVFPNPTTGKVYIEHESEVCYTVTNLLGSVQKAGSSQNGEIDISDLPNGVYILRLRDGERLFSTKIVKVGM